MWGHPASLDSPDSGHTVSGFLYFAQDQLPNLESSLTSLIRGNEIRTYEESDEDRSGLVDDANSIAQLWKQLTVEERREYGILASENRPHPGSIGSSGVTRQAFWPHTPFETQILLEALETESLHRWCLAV